MQDQKSQAREVVAALRRSLAERVGAERYDLWFASTCGFEVRGDRLAVLVPNSFLQDWLRTNFRSALEQAARETLGRDAAVVFEIDPTLAERPVAEVSAVATLNAATPAGGSAEPTLRLVRPDADGETAPPKPKRVTSPRRLHDFAEFVVGPTNRLAYVSALGVVEKLGQISPLVIHGPTGVGKTHLLEAAVETVRRQSAEARTAYLSAEQFTTEFLEALHGRGLPNFRRKFRDLHLLVVDDLQFLAGKKATVIELTHTIDVLQRAGRQIVLSADRAPAELTMLGAEMRNRLTSGLVCRIEPPDLPTRLGITTRMAGKLGLALPEDVRQFVATSFSAHARELAGALKRLLVAQRMHDRPLDLPLAQESLDELLRNRRRPVRLADIERAVCTVFDLEADALQSPRKGSDVSRPRMLAMWLARKYTRAALSEIGGFFGGRSHSTVISAHKKVSAWLTSGESLQLGFGRCRFDEAMRKVEETLLGAAG
jgi:chromosomal replication initiator protein